nr:hypothetical protein [Tanacetum cinerariifolium]
MILSKNENEPTPTRDLDPKFQPIPPVALYSRQKLPPNTPAKNPSKYSRQILPQKKLFFIIKADIILTITHRSHTFLPSQPETYHTVIMGKMVPYEAFACPCGDRDVVLREPYKPKTHGKLYYACPRSKLCEDTFGCKFFYGKRNESIYWLVLLELQRLQFILQDLHRLKLILQDLHRL